MAKTLYTITLTDEEREKLHQIIEQVKESERTILRAKILLMSDVAYLPQYTVTGLAKALETTNTTIQTTRTEYGKNGLEAAVFRKKRVVENGYKFSDEVVAQIIQLSESEPPEGYKRWSTRLLCKVCEERGIVDHIAPSSLSGLLKRAGISLNN